MSADVNGGRGETHDGWDEPESERLWWYPRYVFDYHRKTADLTFAEHGVYALLMDAYYANRGPLRADESRLRRRLGLGHDADPTEIEALRFVVTTFFTEKGGYLHHERMDQELAKANRIIADKRRFGSRGGKAKAAADRLLRATKS